MFIPSLYVYDDDKRKERTMSPDARVERLTAERLAEITEAVDDLILATIDVENGTAERGYRTFKRAAVIALLMREPRALLDAAERVEALERALENTADALEVFAGIAPILRADAAWEAAVRRARAALSGTARTPTPPTHNLGEPRITDTDDEAAAWAKASSEQPARPSLEKTPFTARVEYWQRHPDVAVRDAFEDGRQAGLTQAARTPQGETP